MVTESDAVLATIVTNWGGGGYAGATPKIQSTADISVDRWAALDAVIVLHDTLDEPHHPFNDKFVNKQYTMDIRVTSITSEDQLKLLVEEVEHLLNNTAITGFTSVRVTNKSRASSDRERKVYRNDITVELWARMSSSAIAPAGGATADFAISGDLTVGDDATITDDLIVGGDTALTGTLDVDNIISSTTINIKPSGVTADYIILYTSSNEPKIKGIGGGQLWIMTDGGGINFAPTNDASDYLQMNTVADVPQIKSVGGSDLKFVTDTTALIGVDQIAALNMFGSANAAHVPCALEGADVDPSTDYKWGITTRALEVLTAGAKYFIYSCPMPTTKGGLKLYVSGTTVSVSDADATNYVTSVSVNGYTAGTITAIDTVTTDRTTAGDHADTFVAVDCSGYALIKGRVVAIGADASALDINGLSIKCYYA